MKHTLLISPIWYLWYNPWIIVIKMFMNWPYTRMPPSPAEPRYVKYVNLYQQPGSSNLTGWKLGVGVAC